MQSVTTALWQSSETMVKTSVEPISCHAVCDDSIMTVVWDYGQNIRLLSNWTKLLTSKIPINAFNSAKSTCNKWPNETAYLLLCWQMESNKLAVKKVLKRVAGESLVSRNERISVQSLLSVWLWWRSPFFHLVWYVSLPFSLEQDQGHYRYHFWSLDQPVLPQHILLFFFWYWLQALPMITVGFYSDFPE